jgi:NADP-dependent 3-hydroxy acid dehydrogenase YdfG
MSLFSGPVAMITGAGAGIGHAAARQVAENGARVSITDINADQLQEPLDLVKHKGGQVIATPGDIAEDAVV